MNVSGMYLPYMSFIYNFLKIEKQIDQLFKKFYLVNMYDKVIPD